MSALTTSQFREVRDGFLAGEVDDATMYAAALDYVGRFNAETLLADWRKIREGRRLHGADACGRCGGAGGSSSWPGWVCFDCGGTGRAVEATS